MMPPATGFAGELSAGVCEYGAGDNNPQVSLPGLSWLVLINRACDRENESLQARSAAALNIQERRDVKCA